MKKSKTKSKSKATRATATARPVRSPRQPQKPPRKNNGGPRLDVNDIKTNGGMDLEPHLLQMSTSMAIARSLKRSADRSTHHEAAPFHSAMGVLNGLVSHVELLKARLEAAKKDLREIYGEAENGKSPVPHEPTPPQEFGKKRSAAKTPAPAPKSEKPADNRPRSRPNKLV